MPVPVFTTGEVLTAANMNAVGLWRVTGCTVSSAGGTAATASNGVITVGSGNTSVTVNNAFSTNYDTYRIVVNGCTYSVIDTTLSCRPGDISTASYFGGGFFQQYGTTTLNGLNLSAGNAGAIGITSTVPMSNIFDITDPFISGRQKRMMGMFSLGGNYIAHYGSVLTATGSYTNFTILPASGTMTGGTIRVYGYRN